MTYSLKHVKLKDDIMPRYGDVDVSKTTDMPKFGDALSEVHSTFGEFSKPRSARIKSLSYLENSPRKQSIHRRFSKFRRVDGKIFTIIENAPLIHPEKQGERRESQTPSTPERRESTPVVLRTAKRRPKRSDLKRGDSKIPDISNFPLLVTTTEELRNCIRAKSAPPLKQHSDSQPKLLDRAYEHLRDGDEQPAGPSTKIKLDRGQNHSTNLFIRTVRNHLVADSANFREQRQLERQIKGIQSIQKMNINSINKEKLTILQKSKALPSMLYPDVFTGKHPKCKPDKFKFRDPDSDQNGSDQNDSIDSGSYLCDPSDGKSPYADQPGKRLRTIKREAWSSAVSTLIKSRESKAAKNRVRTKSENSWLGAKKKIS